MYATRALDWQRPAAVALMTLLLSLAALDSPALLHFFSPEEIALALLEYLGELAVIAAVLLAAFTAVDRALPRPGREHRPDPHPGRR